MKLPSNFDKFPYTLEQIKQHKNRAYLLRLYKLWLKQCKKRDTIESWKAYKREYAKNNKEKNKLYKKTYYEKLRNEGKLERLGDKNGQHTK